MIKVIEHGYKKYRTTCHNCKCYFEYELEDIEKGYVKCPDCSGNCSHCTLNANLTSRIDDVIKALKDEVEECDTYDNIQTYLIEHGVEY